MIEKVRKAGILTKGFVYVLIGVLALLSAFSLGGKVAGKNGVIDFLENQTFGKIIVILTGIGLLGYAIWRIFSALYDAKDEGSDKQGYAKRGAHFLSGLAYAGLGVSTLIQGFGGGSSGGDVKQTMTARLLSYEYGQFILYTIAVITLGICFYQFYKGYSKKFLEDIDVQGQVESKEILEKSGTIGFMARGLSFGVLAWLIFKAASENNPANVQGLEGIFGFLQEQQFGNVLMGLMAFGLVAYGVFQYFLARYSSAY